MKTKPAHLTPKPKATNKANFVCFECRKALKQPGSSAWDSAIPERPCPCPNCRGPMTRMGRYFKAPPTRAVQQWLKVELLYCFGEDFWWGNKGLGRKCHNLRSTIDYLAAEGHPIDEIRCRLDQLRRLRSRRT
jgi:hypothetical protein